MELWEHQRKAVEFARTNDHLALFYEVGTGKTATLIHILREDYNRVRKIAPTLIFTPLTVCKQWKTEFARFSKIPQEKIFVLTGPGKKRAEALKHQISLSRDLIVVTNYEAVQIEAFYAQMLKWSPDLVVLDESHLLKDSSGKRVKKIYPLAHAARRRFLSTGTPILNSLLDIFGQYKAMNPDIFGGNFFTFRQRYFVDKNAYMPKNHFPDWQPIPEAAAMIGQVIKQTSLQAKREECLDLPELLKINVPVEMSPEQARVYKQMAKDFVAELGNSVVTAEFAMTKTLRLRQILAGFIAQDSESDATWCSDVPKLDALEDLLSSIGGRKTIIWTEFRPTYTKIASVCEKAGYEVAFLTGDQSASEKEKSIEAFRQGSVNALVANPSAGGTGVNLFEAPFAIFYAKGYNSGHYRQAEGRNYRAGSEMHTRVTQYHLVSEGTLDEVISNALVHKKEVGDEVLRWASKKPLT